MCDNSNLAPNSLPRTVDAYKDNNTKLSVGSRVASTSFSPYGSGNLLNNTIDSLNGTNHVPATRYQAAPSSSHIWASRPNDQSIDGVLSPSLPQTGMRSVPRSFSIMSSPSSDFSDFSLSRNFTPSDAVQDLEKEQLILERDRLIKQVEAATQRLNQMQMSGSRGYSSNANQWSSSPSVPTMLSPEPMVTSSPSSSSTGISSSYYAASSTPFSMSAPGASTATNSMTSIGSTATDTKTVYMTSSPWANVAASKSQFANDEDTQVLPKLETGGFRSNKNRDSTEEPFNYRKLMDKSSNGDWKSLVERIIYHDDQQASVLMQHRLKVSSPALKEKIIDAIVQKAYPLMKNRFGNFLVQRCLEYGNEQHIAKICQEMTGRVMNLAMDQFGCHVVQKALDCVAWPSKTQIISEMCADIITGMTHRYASHVWQKLFELRSDGVSAEEMPPFMTLVNQELKGKWTQIALTETGSLVVQNVFENCVLKDRINCVEEIVANFDTVIKGQWGNWVIQHMVEHADEPYRTIVINKVIENSHIYSVDQFASKAVEKMLKMGDTNIIQGFLDRVVQKSSDRPRIPLIDIASDAHGNYLVQYILQSGTDKQKEEVTTQIKKNMVSLRGSKWGYKCAWLIDKNKRRKE